MRFFEEMEKARQEDRALLVNTRSSSNKMYCPAQDLELMSELVQLMVNRSQSRAQSKDSRTHSRPETLHLANQTGGY